MKFETLPGFRSFYPEQCSVRNYIFDGWRRAAKHFHFLEYDAPTLEPLELYKEKSGEEIVSQLFNFVDKGEREVALRPEITPSLARLAGDKAKSLKRPVKWFSIGEQFRYERPQKGRLRSFYQFNVDILGEPGVAADAELVACLVHCLQGFGLSQSDFKVRLSDRYLWVLFLEHWGLVDSDQASVLSVLDRIHRMDSQQLTNALRPYFDESSDRFIDQLNQLLSVRDIDDLSQYFSSLSLSDEITDRIDARLKDWASLSGLLQSLGVSESIQIDFSIVRGLAYYTGFVFEAFEASGEGRALAGGGRYDDLIERLTGNAMEAVGFAMGDVTLLDLLESKALIPDLSPKPDLMLFFTDESARSKALSDAHYLRSRAWSIDYPLKLQSFSKQFKIANQKRLSFALVYGSEELERGQVLLKNFETGEEIPIERNPEGMHERLKVVFSQVSSDEPSLDKPLKD